MKIASRLNGSIGLMGIVTALLLSLFALNAHAQRADAEPTVAQIYQAANTGQLQKAQAMVDQVLKSHPNSAKAHYVKSELAARGNDLAMARDELATAERLAPGLPFAKAESVQALRNQISQARAAPAPRTEGTAPDTTRSQMGAAPSRSAPAEEPSGRGFPWGAILVVGGVIAVVLLMIRRRSAARAGDGYGGAYGNTSAAPYGQTGYGPVYPPNAGGMPPGAPGMPGAPGSTPGYGQPSMGSSVARGLGAGLAMGAGALAAQEIGRRMFSHEGQHAGDAAGAAAAAGHAPADIDAIDEGMRRNLNTDMGGDNFGIADGGSWDDAGGGSIADGDFGGDAGGDWDT